MKSKTPAVLILITAVAAAGGAWFWFSSAGGHGSSDPGSDPDKQAAAKELFGGDGEGDAAVCSLAESKQQYIWDAEHITFEIETYVGKPMTAAIKMRDAEQIGKFLREGFSATGIDPGNSSSTGSGLATRQDWSRPLPETSLDDSKFAAYLLSRFEPFAKIEKTGMRVLTIEAPDRDSSQGIWNISTLITGYGEDASGKKLYFEQHGSAKITYQTDEEVREGRVIDEWKVADESLVSCPPLMEEVTEKYGLANLPLHDNWKFPDRVGVQYTNCVAVSDYNHDKLPDVAISGNDGVFLLLKNQPDGSMVDVAAESGLPDRLMTTRGQTEVTWFDFNNDGYDDLLLGEMLFRNRQDGGFEWMQKTGFKFKPNPMGTAVADFDCDGLLDIYVLYQGKSRAKKGVKLGWINDESSGDTNQLWRNLGEGKFENVTEQAGCGGGLRKSFAAVWFHANDDIYPDIYVANDFGTNTFLLNNGDGTFKDISEESETADFATSMAVAAGDINGDGLTDIYVANMYSKMGRRIVNQISDEDYTPGVYESLQGSCSGNRLYTNRGDGKPFDEISQQLNINGVGWAYSPAFADFDLDGYLDIYATAGFMSYRRDKPDG